MPAGSRPWTAAAIRSATTGASKWAVEPAFESGRSVASPRAKTFAPAADPERVPVGREPAARRRGEPGVDQELLALVGRDEDQEVVGELLALEAQDDLAVRVDRLDVEERVELDPLLGEDRRRHVRDALDRERPPDRRAEVDRRSVAQAALAELASMRNATSSGAGGHLYGIPAIPITIRPPVNASSAARRPRRPRPCRSGGPHREVLDRLGHDPGAGGEDEVVVGQRPAVGQLDLAGPLRRPGRPSRRRGSPGRRAGSARAGGGWRLARRPSRCT